MCSARQPTFTTTISTSRWHLTALTLALLVILCALSLAHCAPALGSHPSEMGAAAAEAAADASLSEQPFTVHQDDPKIYLANIMKSGKQNECEHSQERKDTCEKCSRSLFDQRSGYEGCCRDFDGIHKFCEEFLGYSLPN